MQEKDTVLEVKNFFPRGDYSETNLYFDMPRRKEAGFPIESGMTITIRP